MTTYVYTSADASAPVLSGTVGALAALLQACLVDGYGARAPAGWTRPFYDAPTNTAVFRPPAGPRHYLQVNDNGPGGAAGAEARLRGYEVMTAHDTGTEPFPTVAQSATGMFVRKSATINGTPRAWRLFADEKGLMLFIISGDYVTYTTSTIFGAFDSWVANDPYASLLIARRAENSGAFNWNTEPFGLNTFLSDSWIIGYAARSYNGALGAAPLYQRTNTALTRANEGDPYGTTGTAFPNPVDGGIILSPVQLAELNITRGRLRGFWQICHPKALNAGDTFSCIDGLLQRDFTAVDFWNTGQIAIEHSATWDNF